MTFVDYLIEYGVFLLKTATIVIALLVVFGGVFASASKHRGRKNSKGNIEIDHINDAVEDLKEQIQQQILDKDTYKNLQKTRKKERKQAEKSKRKADDVTHVSESRLFVLDFNGDMHANQVEALREEISALLMVAENTDEVLLRLESPGGVVHGYGLAASQLQRIRSRGLKLTIAVDMVAASGGYLMACVADRIIAAPFAIVGSIGVIAQLPNFNRLLHKHDIDYEQFTAGEFKRTVTMFGENTDKARQKFQQELEETHVLFKHFVSEYRSKLDINAVATGEHWYGKQAIDLKLVDELKTSDDYLLERVENTQIYSIQYQQPQTFADKLGLSFIKFAEQGVSRLLARFQFNKM